MSAGLSVLTVSVPVSVDPVAPELLIPVAKIAVEFISRDPGHLFEHHQRPTADPEIIPTGIFAHQPVIRDVAKSDFLSPTSGLL